MRAVNIKNLSIQNRMLLTIFVGLLSLITTHLLVEQFFVHSTLSTQNERLSGFAKDIANHIKQSEIDTSLSDIVLGDANFNKPGSGLYAAIFDDDNNILWKSPSVVSPNAIPSRPIKEKLDSEQTLGFFSPAHSQDSSFHRFVIPVLMEGTLQSEYNASTILYVLVYEDSSITDIKMESFKFAVWGGLGFSFILILLAQTIAAKWCVVPFSVLAKDLNSVALGAKPRLDATYPLELRDVVGRINSLIDHESYQSSNYRKTLDNLAHSLKTPLAVLRSSLDDDSTLNNDTLREEVERQVQKMGDLVSYQLSLAGRVGLTSFTQSENLEVIAIEIVDSLEKIHSNRGVLCEFEFDQDLLYKANKGDMQELLGNLLDNSFKYCSKRVLLTMSKDQNSLHIIVDDDGEGVPDDKLDDVIMRGVRADQRVQGHGIGLAIVDDILRVYNGKMSVGHSIELGGACFHITLPL